jgi:hypothetical protein
MLLISIAGILNAQYKVERLRSLQAEEKPLNKGLYYQLPANGFKVDITVTTTTYQRGIYSEYAASILGLTDFIRENNSVSEIESVSIRNTVIPDNNQVFYVRSLGKAGALPNISYTNFGTLLGVNVPPIDKPDINKVNKNNHIRSNRHTEEQYTYSFAEINFEDDFDTIIREELKDSEVVEQTIITARTVEKSDEQKAKELAALIVESKKQRAALISGYSEVNYASETMRYMYEQMLATENEYLRSFTGISYKSTHTYQLVVNIADTTSTYNLGTYLSKDEVIYLQLKRLPSAAPQIDKFDKKSIDQVENTGFFVRLPQMVNAIVRSDKRIFEEKQLFVSQWGTVYSLPVGNFSIMLNPRTGALESVAK